MVAKGECQFCQGKDCTAQREIIERINAYESENTNRVRKLADWLSQWQAGKISFEEYAGKKDALLSEITQFRNSEQSRKELEGKARKRPSMAVGWSVTAGTMEIGRLKCGPVVERYKNDQLAAVQSNCTLYSYEDSIFEGLK